MSQRQKKNKSSYNRNKIQPNDEQPNKPSNGHLTQPDPHAYVNRRRNGGRSCKPYPLHLTNQPIDTNGTDDGCCSWPGEQIAPASSLVQLAADPAVMREKPFHPDYDRGDHNVVYLGQYKHTKHRLLEARKATNKKVALAFLASLVGAFEPLFHLVPPFGAALSNDYGICFIR